MYRLWAILKIGILYTTVTYLSVLMLRESRDQSGTIKLQCHQNMSSGKYSCRPRCARGYFSLAGMTECLPWLNCTDINIITPLDRVGRGAIKQVWRGRWRNHMVTINRLRTKTTFGRTMYFLHGLDNLRFLQPSEHIVQLIGWCGPVFITEFHSLGSADNLPSLLKSESYQSYDNIKTRFNICVSFVKLLHFLHSSPIGTRVLCDSYTVQALLRQILLTSDLSLVLNDVEDIPVVHSPTGLTADCGFIRGDFHSPEQGWLANSTDTQHANMPGSDEKADVWKIPEVCDFFLGPFNITLQSHLSEINSRCKETAPSLRPSTSEILSVYNRILDLLH